MRVKLYMWEYHPHSINFGLNAKKGVLYENQNLLPKEP